MVYSIDKIALNLAENLVSLRKAKGLTQDSLAKLAKTTRASITLLESGTANPTLEILSKVSSALGVSIDELTYKAYAECEYIPAKSIPVDKKSKHGVTLRKLLPHKIRATEIDEIGLQPGAVMKGTPHVQGTKEYFTCIEGQVDVGVLGHVYTLRKGDVLSFPGDKPHSYRNSSKRNAKGIGVVIFNPN